MIGFGPWLTGLKTGEQALFSTEDFRKPEEPWFVVFDIEIWLAKLIGFALIGVDSFAFLSIEFPESAVLLRR